LPALQRILADTGAKGPGPEFIVCAPTLELCSQIKSGIDFLISGISGINVSLLCASVNLNRQIDKLKKEKPRIIVGNPGRLLLLTKMGKMKFKALRFLVLDEADRLLETDSRDETTAFLRILSKETDNRGLTIAACSATVSEKTREYLLPFSENAELLKADEHEILRDRIGHWAIFSESRRKTQTLVSFLTAVKPKKTLVFTGRSYDAGKLVSALRRRKITVSGLYGDMDRKERKEAIDRFRSGKTAVLVSTDLASRGLDIPDISHVVALDTSGSKNTYIHRAGRTGRAGNHGTMICIGDEIELRRLAVLEKKLGIVVHPKELYNGELCDPQRDS
jgi:superfamily II DNA/RNA helicase